MREDDFKEVKHNVKGQEMTFQIEKMDALRGAGLMKFAAQKVLPLFDTVKDIFDGKEKPKDAEELQKYIAQKSDIVFKMIPEALASLTEEELIRYMAKCLGTVKCMKPSGWQPIMDKFEFCIPELEKDIATCLLLTYEVTEFNLGGFFAESGLGSFLPRRNTQQPNA